LNLEERGEKKRIDTESVASSQLKRKNTARRQLYGFNEVIRNKQGTNNIHYRNTASPGYSFHAHAHYAYTKLGSCDIGTKEKSPEHVGRNAAHFLLKEINSSSTLDKYMADQILPFLALCGGKFRTSETTSHFQTNKKIIEQFTKAKIITKKDLIEVRPDPDYIL
jgi:RNA 3'-terminal phosphate cyclase